MGTKLCKRCSTNKNVDEFTKSKKNKDGLGSYCKKCHSIANSKSSKHDSHISVWLEFSKLKRCSCCNKYLEFDLFHKKINGSNGINTECKTCKTFIDKSYWAKNKESKSKRHTEYILENKNIWDKYHKEYREANKSKIKSYCISEEGKKVRKAYSRKYYHEKKKFDLKFKLSDRISGALRFRLKKSKNNKHWESLVGYSYSELKDRLESTLPKDITWDDFIYGDYHIDHIIPLDYFKYEKIESLDFFLAWRLENLRIITSSDNIKKSNKIDQKDQRELLDEIDFFRRYPDMYRVK